MKRHVLQLLFWGLCWSFSKGMASTFLSVGDPIYDSLLYLESQGCIFTGLLTMHPLSRTEVLRLLEEARLYCRVSDELIEEQMHRIASYLSYEPSLSYFRPFDAIRISLQFLPQFYKSGWPLADRGGFALKEGVNWYSIWIFRKEGPTFSFYLAPGIEKSYIKNNKFFLYEGYLSIKRKNWLFLGGRLGQRWGPGVSSTLLLSDAAAPLDLIFMGNDRPWITPMGLMRFSFWISRLSSQRWIKRPLIWGSRIVFKPSPNLEIGLSRTALLGGKGRSEGFSAWWRSFLGINENVKDPAVKEPGDQRLGIDFKLTQKYFGWPFQFYFELGREHLVDNILHKWACLIGLYFPSLKPLKNFSVRLEYSRTPKNWNVHHIYRSGYTYKGDPLGHYLFKKGSYRWLQLKYQVPEKHLELLLTAADFKNELRGDHYEVKLELRRFWAHFWGSFRLHYIFFQKPASKTVFWAGLNLNYNF